MLSLIPTPTPFLRSANLLAPCLSGVFIFLPPTTVDFCQAFPISKKVTNCNVLFICVLFSTVAWNLLNPSNFPYSYPLNVSAQPILNLNASGVPLPVDPHTTL